MGKIRKAVIGTLAVLGIYGTFVGEGGDFPPLYAKKTGTSGGICISAYTKIEPGATFYGPVISLIGKNSGTVNGAYIPIIGSRSSNSKTNGLEASVCNVPFDEKVSTRDVNGIDISVFGQAQKINGIQIGGIATVDEKLRGLQIAGFGGAENMKGIQVFVAGVANKMDGLQIAGAGMVRNGTNVQLGGYLFNDINGSYGKNRKRIIFNYGEW